MTTLPQTTAIRIPQRGPGTPGVLARGPVIGLPAPAAQSMNASDAWRIIRSHIWLIVTMLILSTIGGYLLNVYLASHWPRYTAVGLIKIEPPTTFTSLFNGTASTMDTNTLAVDQKTQVSLLTHDSLMMQVLGRDKVRQTDWFKSFNGNVVLAKEYLEDEVSVRAVPDTRLVAVSMTYSNPADCATIVNEIVTQHLKNQDTDSQNRVLARTTLLKNLKTKYQFRLRDLTSDLRDKAISLSINGMGTPGRLSTKEVEVQEDLKKQFELTANAAQAKAAYEAAIQQANSGTIIPQVQQDVDHDQDVMQAKQQLLRIDSQLAAARATLGPAHKIVIALKQQRQEVQQRLASAIGSARASQTASYIESLRAAQQAAQVALKGINDHIKQAKQELGELTYQMSQYLTAKDEEKATHALLDQVNKELDNMSQIAGASESSGIMWAAYPEVPDIPSFPRLPYTLAATILAGLALSLGIAFARELMDTSVRSPRDIDRVGEMNLLGLVPHEDDDPQVTGAPLPLVIFQAPHSMLAEQYRQVRSRLQHSTSLDSTRSILVTSPSPGDGKTTVACNLAAGLALNGRRILLVDANLRRPELHQVFSIANDSGFSTALSNLEAFSSSICQTQVPNLDVMPSGPRPPNGTELLESQLLSDFIARALEEYDHVIFDSGPLLFVSESMAMAPRVDGVVSVVRARTNSRGLLQRMRDALRQVHAEHIGVVLNAVRSHAGGYYNRNIKTYYAYSNYDS